MKNPLYHRFRSNVVRTLASFHDLKQSSPATKATIFQQFQMSNDTGALARVAEGQMGINREIEYRPDHFNNLVFVGTFYNISHQVLYARLAELEIFCCRIHNYLKIIQRTF